ncbi:MAG: hypothetical protein JW797_13620 [Bradymonadales bacterium]|nr:hypothetical protein [Bradymonadales bacterium]
MLLTQLSVGRCCCDSADEREPDDQEALRLERRYTDDVVLVEPVTQLPRAEQGTVNK